jgi:hypothetical protein
MGCLNQRREAPSSYQWREPVSLVSRVLPATLRRAKMPRFASRVGSQGIIGTSATDFRTEGLDPIYSFDPFPTLETL